MNLFSSPVILFLYLLVLSLEQVNGQKCYALALSGGANKGAYQAGVLHRLARILSPELVEYSVVSGISAGALNSASIGVFEIGKEKQMTQYMVDYWLDTTTKTVWNLWHEGLVGALLHERGLVNDDPALQSINKVIKNSKGFKKDVIVGTVDSQDGSFWALELKNIPQQDQPTAIISSASMPFVFPFRSLDGHEFIDGGSFIDVNIYSAVKKCLEKVGENNFQDIIVDTIILNSAFLNQTNKTSSTLNNFQRYQDIKAYYATLNSVKLAYYTYPDVDFRYFIMPSANLTTGYEELIFSPDVLEPMISLGEKDAQTVYEMGNNEASNRFQEWYETKIQKRNGKEIPTLSQFIYNL